MSSLAVGTVIYASVVGLLCLAVSVTGRERTPTTDTALTIVGVAALLVSVVGLVGALGRPHTEEFATHLGYLVTAPLILPLTASAMHGDRGRWTSAGFAVGCLVLVVVLVRALATADG